MLWRKLKADERNHILSVLDVIRYEADRMEDAVVSTPNFNYVGFGTALEAIRALWECLTT
jgi:hypothetical protein